MNLAMPEIAIAAHDTAIAPQEGQTLSEVPLRVKGFLAFAAVVIYAVLLTTFTFNKKAELVNEFEHLQDLYKVEDGLRQVDATAFHIVMAVFMNPKTGRPENGGPALPGKLRIAQAKERRTDGALSCCRGESCRCRASGCNRPPNIPLRRDWPQMNAELLKVKIEITQHIDESTREQKATAESFHMLWDSAALASLLFGLIGLLLLGAIIGLFFTRLTNDLHTLKARALGIIKGERNTLHAGDPQRRGGRIDAGGEPDGHGSGRAGKGTGDHAAEILPSRENGGGGCAGRRRGS